MKHKEYHLLLFTSFGFFFMWVDLCIGHLSAEQFKFFMSIPLVFLPCAAVMAIVTAFWPTPLNRNLFRVICFLAILIGILGFYFHLLRIQQNLTGSIQWEILIRLMRYPPLFAPFAISGLGILGMMICRKEP